MVRFLQALSAPMSSVRLYAVPVLFLAVFAAISLFTAVTVSRQGDIAELVNRAAEQRMLSERVVKESIIDKYGAEVDRTLDRIDRNLESLRAETPTTLGGADRDAMRLLAELEEAAAQLRRSVQTCRESGDEGIGSAERTALARSSETVVASADALVDELSGQARKVLGQRALAGLVLALVVGALALGLTWKAAEAQRRLREDLEQRDRAEKDLRRLVDSLPDATVVVSKDGEIMLVNGRTEEVFGYSLEDLVGQPVEILMPEHLRGGHKGLRSGYFARPESRPMGSGRQFFARRKDGSTFAADINLSPMRGADGVLAVASVRDVTELAQARAALEARSEELARSNAELERFAYVASHDLQEPLRKIQAFGGRLRDRYADEIDDRGRDYLRRMDSAAERMKLLIADLLALSRVGTKENAFERVELADVLRDVVSDLSEAADGAKVIVEELPVVDADVTQMRQLFQNLIGNALKFRREGVEHRVRVFGEEVEPEPMKPPAVRIHVEDNGIGIDEQYAERIFEVFQRLHGRDSYEGSGVGLAVCKKIVERHRGAITLSSIPGEGTRFSVTLPVEREESP